MQGASLFDIISLLVLRQFLPDSIELFKPQKDLFFSIPQIRTLDRITGHLGFFELGVDRGVLALELLDLLFSAL